MARNLAGELSGVCARSTALLFGGAGRVLPTRLRSRVKRSKIKPCMSKYKLLYTVKLRMAH